MRLALPQRESGGPAGATAARAPGRVIAESRPPLRTIKAAAPSFGVEVFPAGIHEAGDIVGTIEAFAREADGGLIVLPSPPATMHRDLIVTLAARHRLPATTLSATTDGGLISYGQIR